MLASIAGAHLLLIWCLLQSLPESAHAPLVTPLFVRPVAVDSAPSELPPIKPPAAPATPHPVWLAIPEVPVTAQAPTPVTAQAPTPVAVEVATTTTPAPTIALVAAPAAASAPSTIRAAPPERQIAISQVEYLSPPVLTYPLAARRLREQGQVQVRVRVDEQGRPERYVVVHSSGSERLDEAALVTVRATRFKPYAEDGQPRPFWVVMPLIFELDT